jgi:hypothetical protein
MYQALGPMYPQKWFSSIELLDLPSHVIDSILNSEMSVSVAELNGIKDAALQAELAESILD